MTLHPRNDSFAVGKTRWYWPPISHLLLMLGLAAAILFVAASFNFLGEMQTPDSLWLRLLGVLILACVVFPLAGFASKLWSWLRLWRNGAVIPGVVITMQEGQRSQRMTPWIAIGYRFISPDGRECTSVAAEVYSSFSQIRKPNVGDSIVVLYVSDDLHELL